MADEWWQRPDGLPAGWGHAAPSAHETAAAAAPAPAALPAGIERSRTDLQQLRDEAAALQPRDAIEAPMPWCAPDGVPAALEAIVNTTAWLLGERPLSPIGSERHTYPDLPLGRQQAQAQRIVWGEEASELGEWYAGGVRRTLRWATGRADGERPLSA